MKLEGDNLELVMWLFLFLLSITLLAVIVLSVKTEFFPEPCVQIQQNENYSEFLEVVESNCGSTQFVKRHGESEWSVFVQQCKGEYCKYDYVKVEDCVK
jgi:hypothetical protein